MPLFFDSYFTQEDHTALTANMPPLSRENYIAKSGNLYNFYKCQRGFRTIQSLIYKTDFFQAIMNAMCGG